MQAALRTCARLGPEAPIDAIIAEAAVSRGTFYNYFTTREEVLAEVASAVSDRLLTQAITFRSLADPADRVSRSLRTFVRLAAADPTAAAVIVRIALLAAPLGIRMRDYLSADVDDGLASGRFRAPSTQAACDVILGLGLMGMRSVLRGEVPPEHAEHIAEMALRGLGVDDAAEVVGRALEG